MADQSDIEKIEKLLSVFASPFSTDEDEKVAVRELKRIGKAAHDYFVHNLVNGNVQERAFAAGVLGAMQDKDALPSLLAALDREESSSVKIKIVVALGELGDPRAVAPLLALDVSHMHEGSLPAAAGALKKVAIGRDLLEPLSKMLEESDHMRRLFSVHALKILRDLRAVPYLIELLEREEIGMIRWETALALGELGDVQAVEPLIAALKTPEDSSGPAAIALARLGTDQAIDAVIEALSSSNEMVRDMAVQGLRIARSKRAVKPLVAELKDPDPQFRIAVCDSLAQIGGDEAVSALIAMLDDEDPEVQDVAMDGLQTIGTPEALAAIAGRAK